MSAWHCSFLVVRSIGLTLILSYGRVPFLDSIMHKRAVSCELCGKAFFPKSLPFHLQACQKKQAYLPVPCQYCDVEVIAAELNVHYKRCRKAREARTSLRNKTTRIQKVSTPLHCLPSKSAEDTSSRGRVACAVCNRYFSRDRIGTHQQICRKNSRPNRRGVFDSTKQRVLGTDMVDSSYRGKRGQVVKRRQARITDGGKAKWREDSQQLRQAMRVAKMYKKIEGRGGDVSLLPPPPRMPDPTNFIQCPFCSRTFNPQAGERHIKACEHTVHRPKMLMQNHRGPYRPDFKKTSFGSGRSPMQARLPSLSRAGRFGGQSGGRPMMKSPKGRVHGAGGIGLTNASSVDNPLVSSPHQSFARPF